MPPPSDAAEGRHGDEAAVQEAIIYVNGSRHVLPSGRGDATLLQYLRGEKERKKTTESTGATEKKRSPSPASSHPSFDSTPSRPPQNSRTEKQTKSDDLRLTGTKLVCGEGGCGACTVTLVDRNTAGEVRARPVNACLFPLYSAEGAAVVTVEGLLEGGGGGDGGRSGGNKGLHPLPAALASAHGSQCGFCSPGFVMAAHSCLAAHAARGTRTGGGGDEGGRCGGETKGCRAPAAASSASCPLRKPTEDIEDVFSGNLCRCTGYRPIIDAFRPFFDEGEERNDGEGGKFAPPARLSGEEEAAPPSPLPSSPRSIIDASTLLPRELLTRSKPELHFPAAPSGERDENESGGGVEWHRPTSLRSLLRLRASSASSRGSPCTLVGGSTEVGIECAQKGARHAVRIDISSVPELSELDFGVAGGGEAPAGDGHLSIGAGATLEDLLEAASGASLSSGAASALAFGLQLNERLEIGKLF